MLGDPEIEMSAESCQQAVAQVLARLRAVRAQARERRLVLDAQQQAPTHVESRSGNSPSSFS